VVRIETSAGTLTKIKAGGSGFLSQGDPRLLFGLGSDSVARSLEVTWPSGLVQRFPGPAAGSSLLVVEGQANPREVREHRLDLPDPLTPAEKQWRTMRVRQGQTLPAIEVRSLDGRTHRLEDLMPDDRPVLVNFWATWCRPCRQEMPELERLYQDAALAVIGLSVDRSEDTGSIARYLEPLGISYPIATIEPDQLDLLFTTPDFGIPLSLLFDQQGRLLEVLSGWSPETRSRLDDVIKRSRD